MTISATQHNNNTHRESESDGLRAQAIEFGLTADEYDKILSILGRNPNLTELGIFSVMWSEHCSYKTTRKWLKTLPTEAEHVICGPGENAGVIDIGDGDAIIFKMESHNHPSYIEPYQGAATGVGGILRDVFTMGARPIANMNALRFGDITHPKTKQLLSGVVAGIGGYGNCVGVPTVGGETNFHKSYNGNILVNAMTVGLARSDNIFYSAAAGVGNPVVYVGSKTGRDGIHGATMASAEFNDDSDEKRPTVQVGDPFTEKLLIEACMELMATDAIIAIQDMGAAGLTSSSLEMAGKGNCGIELELDKVPMREENMTPYELMLSESQERMLMVLKPGKEEIARKIFEKWELNIATIGKITDTGKMILKWHGEIVADLPITPMSNDAPIYDREYSIIRKQEGANHNLLIDCNSSKAQIEDALIKLVSCPDVASKDWIWQQYDSMVMNDTIASSGMAEAAIVRIHNSNKAIAITTDCTPRYCHADPIEGGKQAVAESWRNLTATGATPLAITNCLNFGNPERKEIMGQIVGCIKGMAEACDKLQYPVVSGNVSLYNETNGQAIFPTPAIGGVGIIKDLSLYAKNFVTEEGLALLLIGNSKGHIGASLYLREIQNLEEGAPPPVNLELERTNGDFVRQLITSKQVAACRDLSDGGLLVGIAEMCIPKNIGAILNISDVIASTGNAIKACFGEDQARYILAVDQQYVKQIMLQAQEKNIEYHLIGETAGDKIFIEGGYCNLEINKLAKLHTEWLRDYMTI